MPQPNKFLIRQAYMASEAFSVRQQTHNLYAVPKIDFPYWVLSRHQGWRGDERILDINPANGLFFDLVHDLFPAGEYYAVDGSGEILRTATQHPRSSGIRFAVSDVCALPFASNTFDVIIADQSLYQVPHLDDTLAELHRVIKPTGLLFASTHSQYTMAEFETLTRRALILLGKPSRANENIMGQYLSDFSLENGGMKLARHFRAVARHEIPNAFVFRETKPVIDYLNGSRAVREAGLPLGVAWEDYIAVMTDQIRRLISHFGELTVNRLSGVLLATDNGGFANHYFSLLD